MRKSEAARLNGTDPDALTFEVLPGDCCPRCPPAERLADLKIGMPVALSGTPSKGVIRYVCPVCRLVWDTGWHMENVRSYSPFSDRFINHREDLESHPTGEILYPAGPRSAFTSAQVAANEGRGE